MSKSKSKPIAILLTLAAATLLPACDLAASVLDTFGGPSSLCTQLDDPHCRRPAPDDLTPS